MSEEIVVSVSNLTKVFHLYNSPLDRLKEGLHPLRKKYHKDFYSLNDVSFDIKKGETVGILGKNGAGKSTLLKIITGVLTESSGTVTTKGKIASLLELGAGFNAEMTGIENIYLNGTIMNFSREEMDKKLQGIIEFADIGEYIDHPVKCYSSGMFARLAFAVAINVNAEILIVDEALSVGDAAFQMKCFNKFQELQDSGVTILFVTHDLESIIRFCTRGIVLDTGKTVFNSLPKEAVDVFKQIMTGSYSPDKNEAESDGRENNTQKISNNNNALEYGNNKASIVDYSLIMDNKPCTVIENLKDYRVTMQVKFSEEISNPIFAVSIKDLKGMEITGVNTHQLKMTTGVFKPNDVINVNFDQCANFRSGKYALSLGCVTYTKSGEIEVFNRLYDVILFEVIGSNEFCGFYDMQSKLEITHA